METLLGLGGWSWMTLAAVLFVLELLAPGIFFMWFGFAAVVTGLIVFLFGPAWQWQLIGFCLSSVAAVVATLKYLRKHPFESELPLLNERALQQIGQTFDLLDPIVNGRGSVRIGDSIWRVAGPELPRGTRVKVLGADGTLLTVGPIPASTAPV
jgi:membrane protein implicated in regulation of membrane protease activity